MNPAADPVEAAAQAVADGVPLEWPRQDGGSTSPDDIAALDQLRVLEQLAAVARSSGESGIRAADPAAGGPDDPTGVRWGPLVIREHIGGGAFGDVYRAWDPALARDVALKILRRRALGPGQAAAALQEGQLLARVRHPGVLTVHGALEIDGEVGIWTEFLKGRTLAQIVDRDGPLGEREAATVADAVLGALGAVHAAGLLHRDLKAQNVIREEGGRVVLVDFGLGIEMPPPGARMESVAGTPRYLAPEVAAGHPPSRRADLYAVGVLLFFLVTGDFPASADGRGQRTRLSDLRPGLSTPFVSVVERALDARVDARFDSTGDMQAALAQAFDARGQEASDARRTGRRPANRWWRPLVAGAAAATVLLLALLSWPSRAIPFKERDWLLIADLSSQPGDVALARTLHEALTIAVQQSQHVNIMGRLRIAEGLTRMQQPGASTADERVALELARREGARVVLAGTVTTSGESTRVTVRALAPESGTLLFALATTAAARGEHVLEALDGLARDIRRQLGEAVSRIDSSSRPLAEVTTPSLEALEHYSRAVEARANGKVDEVEAPLRAALALDARFAMAHMKLGDYLSSIAGDETEARTHLDQAYALRDRVSLREQYQIAAAWFNTQERYEEARAQLQPLVGLYPDEAEFRFDLALAHYALGELQEGIAQLREAIRTAPHWTRVRGSLVLLLAQANQARLALDAYDEARRAGLSSAHLEWAHGLALLGADDVAGAKQVFSTLATSGQAYYATLGDLHLAKSLLHEGALEDAARVATRALTAATAQGDANHQLLFRLLLADTHAALGRPALARQHLDAIVAAWTPALRVEDLRRAGSLYLALGLTSDAQAVRRRLEDVRTTAPSRLLDGALALLTGELQVATGDLASARTSLEWAAAARRWYEVPMALATLSEAEGRVDDARRHWRDVLAARGQILQDGSPLDLVRARDRLARLP